MASTSNGEPTGLLRESPSGEQLRLVRNAGAAHLVGECADLPFGSGIELEDSARAIVVHRNCGATVAIATQVILARGPQREVVTVLEGPQRLILERLANGDLMVIGPQLPPEAMVRRETRFLDLSISYAEDPALSPAPESRHLEFANFNFGASGRAAGISEEALLKIAGWSQQASGIHRSEWGSWTGEVPYGDDPSESRLIREGIQYFESNYGAESR